MATEALRGVQTPTTAEPLRREGPLRRNLTTTWMVAVRELIRLRRTPSRIISGLAQPLLFLFVLGAGLKNVVGQNAGAGFDYIQFLFPGIVAMSILTSGLMAAISIVWDREWGFLREMLVAPVSRASLVLGKAIGGGSVAVVQGVLLVVVAPIIGVDLSVGSFFAMLGFLLLMAFALVSFGVVVAARMQRLESFQMVMALVLQPMIFLSGAIFPVRRLPEWLGVIVRFNPASYPVDAIRRIVLPGSPGLTIGGSLLPIWSEALITLGFGLAMLTLAVRLFSHTD